MTRPRFLLTIGASWVLNALLLAHPQIFDWSDRGAVVLSAGAVYYELNRAESASRSEEAYLEKANAPLPLTEADLQESSLSLARVKVEALENPAGEDLFSEPIGPSSLGLVMP